MKRLDKKLIKNITIFIIVSGFILALIASCIVLSTPSSSYVYLSDLYTSKSYSDLYISESTYAEDMTTLVEPTIANIKSQSTFNTSDGTTLNYNKFIVENPVGTIIISHGFTEFASKYSELIYYFTSLNYNVYIPEHRGHGFSTRATDDFSLVHITDFQDYVNDFKEFIDRVVIPENTGSNLYLYAHSMGGAIGTLYLEQNPGIIEAAILSAPMLEPATGNYPNFIAKAIANMYTWLGKGKEYVFGHKPFSGEKEPESDATYSIARYSYTFDKRLENTMQQTNGASFGWLKAALTGAKKAVKNAHLLEGTPVLIFQATDDTYVNPSAQLKVANSADSVELIIVEDARHELYLEKDETLVKYLDVVLSFFEQFK